MNPVPIRFRALELRRFLGFEAWIATTRLSRLLGLAWLSRDRAAAGLLIPRCRSVHTFGMRFPLDLLFLDGEGRVLDVRRDVPARRICRCPAAETVLELPSPLVDPKGQRYSRLQPGEKLVRLGLILRCSRRSKSWRRWWSARTMIRPASFSATT